MKMSKDSSGKCYQYNKLRLPNKPCEEYQNLIKKGKEKKQQLRNEWYKISLKMKNRNYLITGKNIRKYGEIKMLHK